jgi:putative Ca2+/H+ antiporter (TMEM165/GDT1 family)
VIDMLAPSGARLPDLSAGGRDLRFCHVAVAGTKGDPFDPARKVTVNFAVVVAVFPIIFLGELPDKTMFASLVLSTRGKPFSVWLGAAGAFLVHVAIAVTIGVALFRILPHRAVDAVVAAMFLVGAALALREATQDHEEEIVEREVATKRRVASTAFIVIFLAEWGDLTQILTANLAAHYHAPLSVAVVLALWAVAGLAVVGGQSLLRFINIRTLRIVTAVVLVGLAGFAAWEAFR